MPTDPILLAKMRHFLTYLDTKFMPTFRDFMLSPQSTITAEDYAKVLDVVQGFLPETGFFSGEWSIADAAATALLNIANLSLEHSLTRNKSEEPKRMLEILKSPRFARLRQYVDDNVVRPSYQADYNEVRVSS